MVWRIRALAAVLSLLLSGLAATLACAQSLEEQLAKEDPSQLAKEARTRGEIVRGAILFHQGNINCSKCHQSALGHLQIGPDLASLGDDVTDASVVESVLQPSLQITKGYETLVILTADGQTLNGIKISEDSDSITIRDKDDIDRSIRISRDNVDVMRTSSVSSMPTGLVNELKSRQQFLDLLRYVFDIRKRGKTKSRLTQPKVKRQLDSSLRGLVLIQQHNCIACHDAGSRVSPVATKQAPDLSWSASNLNPEYIRKFIASPHSVKPGATMPDLPGRLSANQREESSNAITHFLLKKFKSKFKAGKIDSSAVNRGFELFNSVGCVACHAPRSKLANEQSISESTPLGPLENKYDVRGLTEFLKDPLPVRSSGHMPNMQLTHFEATDIANFLLQSQANSSNTWQVDSKLAGTGNRRFRELNCNACHSGIIDDSASVTRSKPISELDVNSGCLSRSSGQWPEFTFSPTDHQSIKDYLQNSPKPLELQEQIDVVLTSFNCVACHDRDGLGGISPDRNPHFKTTNLNLGDQGRIPPTLTGVAAKLKPDWLRDVLVNGRSIRPYMKTRMPKFGEANIKPLIPLLESADALPEVSYFDFEDQKKIREQGHVLAGNKGLNCVACHTYQYKISDTMPAVDLTEMAERLEKNWFYQYMLDPQRFSPNTVMPSFWPGGKAIRSDIDGTTESQVEAIWQYLLDGRQARAPAGIVRKPLEIAVTNEARMLRRKYPGIGKRGIGVGYPGGINIAFDAEQLRLGSIWRGKFVEASGVWRGQGSGNVRPLGRPVNFGAGPNIDDMESPWVVDNGRPPKHQFKGYSLDRLQRPTFKYTFDSIEIADFVSTFEDADGKTQMRRKITLHSKRGRNDLGFMVRSEAPITLTEAQIQIGENLSIRFKSPAAPSIVKSESDEHVSIPINLIANETRELVLEYILK